MKPRFPGEVVVYGPCIHKRGLWPSQLELELYGFMYGNQKEINRRVAVTSLFTADAILILFSVSWD